MILIGGLKTLFVKMPDESCRKCGFELKELSKCSGCNKLYQQICIRCKNTTLPKIHYCVIDICISS